MECNMFRIGYIKLFSCGVVGFGFGYIFFFLIKRSKYNKEKCNKEKNKVMENKIFRDNLMNNSVFKIINCMVFVFYFIVSIRVCYFLLNGTSYAIIRSMYQGYYGYASVFPNSAMKTIDTYFAHPFLYVLVPIILISFFEKKLKKRWLIISIGNIIMYLLCSASRFLLLYFIIELAFCICYYYRNLLKKYRKKIFKVLIALCMIIFLMTYIRSKTVSGGNYTIMQNLYAYFTVEFPLMDYWLDYIPHGFYGFGTAFLHGTFGVLSPVIRFLNIPMEKYNMLTKIIVPTEENFIGVFPWKKYNAFISIFYFFFLDFGYIGVLLEMFIFGCICSNINFTKHIYNFCKVAVL